MSNIIETGAIGEKLVLEYLNETGQYGKVSLSENVYDMHKDIIADTAKVEVKTRTVIRKYCAMPLERSQWYKADTADKLFFVSNPTAQDENVVIYEATPDSFFVVDSFGPRKSTTRMYDLTKMKKVKTINDPSVIKSMYNLSISTYKQ